MIGSTSLSSRVLYDLFLLGVAISLITVSLQLWHLKTWEPQPDAISKPKVNAVPSSLPSSDPPPAKPSIEPVWLIATISSGKAQARRNLIRKTWQKLYTQGNPLITTRFVVASPGYSWLRKIEAENQTHGDLVLLQDTNEDAQSPPTTKAIEFFQQLVGSQTTRKRPSKATNTTFKETPANGHKSTYKFVSKLEDNAFFAAIPFYDRFLRQLVDNPAGLNSTMIAQRLPKQFHDELSPAGQFYTLSFDLVETLVQQYEKTPFPKLHEDKRVGKLLEEADKGFDFHPLDKSKDSVEYGKGKPDKSTIEMHKMKSDASYKKAATLFDKSGFVGAEWLNEELKQEEEQEKKKAAERERKKQEAKAAKEKAEKAEKEAQEAEEQSDEDGETTKETNDDKKEDQKSESKPDSDDSGKEDGKKVQEEGEWKLKEDTEAKSKDKDEKQEGEDKTKKVTKAAEKGDNSEEKASADSADEDKKVGSDGEKETVTKEVELESDKTS